MYIPVLTFLVVLTNTTHKHSTGSAGLTVIHSAMAAFETIWVSCIFVSVVFQLLALFVSAAQAVQSLSPQSKTGVSGSSPG